MVLGLVLALTRPGFDLTHHALSLLTLGEHGWLQRANLVLTGLMVLAAAAGAGRALRSGRGLAVAACLAVFGVCMVLSAVALPDPVNGFPAGPAAGSVSGSGSGSGEVTTHGLLHLMAGALGFLALAVGAAAEGRWRASIGERSAARRSTGLGVVVLVGFLAGAALATLSVGTALLWVAVLAGFAWVALACARLHSHVPHPVFALRGQPAS